MKKAWIGVGVLLVLLVSGIVTMVIMDRIHSSLARDLLQAAALAEEDWGQAKALADSARADWERYEHLTAALADHEPLEEMDALFLQLQVCMRQDKQLAFSLTCARLAGIARRLSESHCPSWWNLL